MIGPADIEDMMLDYEAENTPVAERQAPARQSDCLLGWAWWLTPAAVAGLRGSKGRRVENGSARPGRPGSSR